MTPTLSLFAKPHSASVEKHEDGSSQTLSIPCDRAEEDLPGKT